MIRILCLAVSLLFWDTLVMGQSLSIHGNATNLGGGCYRLTMAQGNQRGAVWYAGTVDITTSWEMSAQVYLGTNNANGADGMTFALRHPTAPTLGANGSLMGYGGSGTFPAIQPSIAVEMDTYASGAGSPGAGDPAYDHIAIHQNGNVSHMSANALAGPVVASSNSNNIEDGDEHHLRVTYDAPTQTLSVYFNCVFRLSTVVDIEAILGSSTARWGFTAATGGSNNLHRVCDAEWIVVGDSELEDVSACAGEVVELAVPGNALNTVWSPSTGLSSTTANVVQATLDASQSYTVSYEDICGAVTNLNVDVEVIDVPNPGLPADSINCNASEIVLNNGPWPAGFTGTWDDGTTAPTQSFSGAVTASLTVTHDASGCAQTATVDVVALDLPTLSLGPDETLCPGIPVVYDFTGVDPNVGFTWNGSPGSPQFFTNQPGTIIVDYGLANCTASDTVEIAQYPTYSVVWSENPIVLCLDEVVPTNAVDASWSGAPVTWNWSNGATTSAIDIDQAGVYDVEITTDNCSFMYSVQALDSPNQGVNLGADVLLCAAEVATFTSGYAAANTLWVSGGSASGQYASSTSVSGGSATVIAQVTIGACVERDTALVAHVPFFNAGLPATLDLCIDDSLFLAPALGAETYTWSNGVVEASQWVNAPGTYSLSMDLDGCTFTDEVVVAPSANTGVDLGLDAVACNGDPINLSSGYSAAQTQWWQNGIYQGTAAAWTVLNQDATVVAQVTIGACVQRDTVVIDYAPVFNTGLPTTLPLCNGDSTWLAANAGAPSYNWSTGATTAGTWLTSPGIVTLTTPIQGCDYSTNVAVQNVPLPVFDLGPNSTLCAGESVLLSTGLFNADETVWSNGSVGPTLEVSNAGTYTVAVTENGCTATDAITIAVQPLPIFDLGPDVQLCPDEEAFFYIYPFPAGATASWSTGSAGTSVTTNSPGVYSALVNWNGCLWTDDIVVERAAPIFIDIVEPLQFCEGATMVVSAENPPNLFPIQYDWNNGETTPAIQIDRQGIYSVTAQNACDSVTKSFLVTLEYCECPVYVPSAFTPDNDGANDWWLPVLGCTPETYRLEVFNTWGELIFATEDPEIGWIGQVEEDPETADHSGYFTRSNVYHWRIFVAFPDEDSPLAAVEQTYQGHVHMVR